jgi:hypothetical protein
MSCSSQIAVAATITLGALCAAAEVENQTIVVCAPGAPGSTEEAQPSMDAFASALSTKSGRSFTAVYQPSEADGAKQIAQATLAIVSLPFFLAHEKALALHPRLEAMQEGRPALEQWALVAKRGAIHKPADLAGYSIVSNAAYAPAFVRGCVLGSFGALPRDARLVQSIAVLSSLRRAADGAAVAVVLDGPQQAALASLAFASRLEVVTRSPAMPAGLVVAVDARVPPSAWGPIERGLRALAGDRTGAAALHAIHMDGFTPLDDHALATARAAYAHTP